MTGKKGRSSGSFRKEKQRLGRLLRDKSVMFVVARVYDCFSMSL